MLEMGADQIHILIMNHTTTVVFWGPYEVENVTLKFPLGWALGVGFVSLASRGWRASDRVFGVSERAEHKGSWRSGTFP